jgi:hypothetical protein
VSHPPVLRARLAVMFPLSSSNSSPPFRSISRGGGPSTCIPGRCGSRCGGHSCRRPARPKWGVRLIPKRLTASSVARPRALAHGVRWRAPAHRFGFAGSTQFCSAAGRARTREYEIGHL